MCDFALLTYSEGKKVKQKYTKTCPICERTFETKYKTQICDTERCTYIRAKLAKLPAQSMPRAEGIEHYGRLWDVPFRSLGRSKYRALAVAIREFCEVVGSREFCYFELPAHIKAQYSNASLGGLANSNGTPIQRTNQVIRARGTGKSFVVWEYVGEIE